MKENEYVSVGFTLRWGEMRFLRAHAEVFADPKDLFDLICSGYPDVMNDDSPVTGNGIAVGKDLDTGTLWFRAPGSMYKVDTYKGFLYSVSKTGEGYATEGYTASIHFGFPVLLRESYVAGVWSIGDQRMDRVRSLAHSSGAFNEMKKAEQALKYRIDKLVGAS